MVKKYRFYIGTNNKDTGKRIENYKQILNETLDRVFDNYTFILANGRYKYFDGHSEQELTVIVEFVDFCDVIKDDKTLKNITHYIKNQLNQELILVEIQEINTQLI